MERLYPCKKVRNLFIILLLITTHGCRSVEMKEILNLTDGWQFGKSGESGESAGWYKATVPGTIHTDLLNAGLIEDPYYGCNEKDLRWIGESEWLYRKSFFIGGDQKYSQNINLVFDGLDTYATVFLNGSELGESSNMFRRWKFDCTGKLRRGENTIEIRFKPAIKHYLADSASNGYIIPGGKWVYARKAAYHFGWDWGPTFITCGITAPVYLEIWKNHYPQDLFLYCSDISEKRALVITEFIIDPAIKEGATITVKESGSNKVYLKKKIELNPQITSYKEEFEIEDPKLWWCNGLGEPHIYDLIFEIKTDSGDRWHKEIPFGVRKIEVINEDDSIGRSFYIKLNDKPVYIKGANYIPQSSFITEVTDNDYCKIIETARESNMNMLRVWGGGVYEKDIFYELCSRNGILVWQDFMFACAMYPSNPSFLENVKEECEYQIKRLRNHPSIALWCGNNESVEAWHNWGWQKSLSISASDSEKIWNGYLEIFHKIIPESLRKFDNGRFYLPSSPQYGWGREKSMTHTDSHYWGVWWGLQPIETYIKKVPRFMSEFGLQAMPSLSVIRRFQPESADTLFSPQLKSHQKHPTGFESISAYLQYENLFPKDLISYIYLSQLVQAKGIGMAIEAQRRSRPYCMGSLYWQLNDCWPVTSWSGMDSGHNWKALQYSIRNLYKDILISLIIEDGKLNVNIISDRTKDVNGRLVLTLHGFDNSENEIFNRNVSIEAGSSAAIYSTDIKNPESIPNPETTLIEAEFKTAEGDLYTNNKFFVPYGSLKTKPVTIERKFSFKKDELLLELSSDRFAPFVYIYTRNCSSTFSDNFFHLFPGERRVITCKSHLTPAKLKDEIEIYTMNNYFEENQNPIIKTSGQ